MTRGRKKDMTIPPTRALVQQRDYRARRAQYVNDLEDRCRKVEEENLQLRRDLEAARAGQAPAIAYNTQTAQASSELMHHLSLASASLVKFQHIAFPERHASVPEAVGISAGPSNHSLPHLDAILPGLRPASFPSPAPSPPYAYPPPTSSGSHNHNPPNKKRLYREDSPHSPILGRPKNMTMPHSSPNPSLSPSQGSDCCGGILDCTDLVERDDDSASDVSSQGFSRKSGFSSAPHRSHR